MMYMSLIANILYPVDFSPSCVAMAAYVKRAAALLGATVSLIHVVDPTGYNGLQLYVRPISEASEEHHLVALGASGKVLVKKKFTQKQLLAFTANMQTSLIGPRSML
jgi:nucleotide-binding universal stress UspA family protein